MQGNQMFCVSSLDYNEVFKFFVYDMYRLNEWLITIIYSYDLKFIFIYVVRDQNLKKNIIVICSNTITQHTSMWLWTLTIDF